MSLGWQELLLVFFIVLLLFGAKRIPDIARSLGKASKEFKKAKEDLVKESKEMMDAAEKHADQEAGEEVEKTDKPHQA